MTGQTLREAMEKAQSEKEFQQKITDLCDLLGIKWHHETDSRRSKKGFPDLVLAGIRVVFVELKTESGKVTKEQQEWIDKVRAAGGIIHVWRPSDWDRIEKYLRKLSGR